MKVETHFFHLVYIIRLYPHDLSPQLFLDLFHLQPCLLVMNKIYRDTLAAESTRST